MLTRYFSASIFLLSAALLTLGAAPAQAQADLLGDLESTTPPARREVVQATFKGTHIINSQTVEIEGPGTLNFLIQHRFGTIDQGPYELFGLDQAVLRLAFEYGLTDKVALGVGRYNVDKIFDGFVKYRALRQTSGGGNVTPVSVTLFTSAAIMTRTFKGTDEADRTTASRLAYTYQALIARKFSPELSVQLMPTLVHRNYVTAADGKNDVYALGAGFRQKITKRIALTGDYFYLLPGGKSAAMRNPLGLGVDIETGGHVFQLHLSNSRGMAEAVSLTQTTDNFLTGGIYFGFAVARNFTVRSNLR